MSIFERLLSRRVVVVTVLVALILGSVSAVYAQGQTGSATGTTGGLVKKRGMWETTLYCIGGAATGIPANSEPGRAMCASELAQEGFMCGCSPSADGSMAVSGITPTLGEYMAVAMAIPPVSTAEYIADLGNNIGLPSIKSAQAQGIGYKALNPVLGMWKAFRNLAYSLYIIIFLVIGVMIMFRTKVNAQTIISIQNALPNLLITLILITFSYAIAGFIVDLIYVTMYLLVYTAAANNLITDPQVVMENVMSKNVFWLIMQGKDRIHSIASDAVANFVLSITGESGLAGAAGWLSKPLAFVIIGLGVLVGMFKTLWQLIQSYFMIIVGTIIGPLQLLLNGLPGSKAFSNWIRNLLANAAVFPVVLAMMLFGAILMGPGTEKFAADGALSNPFNVNTGQGYLPGNGSTSSEWVPPFLSFIAQGDDEGIESSAATLQETFMALLGVFIILMTPAAAQMTRDVLKVEQLKYTSAIGESIQQGMGLGKLPLGYIQGWRQQAEADRRQRKLMEYQASLLKSGTSKTQQGVDTEKGKRE